MAGEPRAEDRRVHDAVGGHQARRRTGRGCSRPCRSPRSAASSGGTTGRPGASRSRPAGRPSGRGSAPPPPRRLPGRRPGRRGRPSRGAGPRTPTPAPRPRRRARARRGRPGRRRGRRREGEHRTSRRARVGAHQPRRWRSRTGAPGPRPGRVDEGRDPAPDVCSFLSPVSPEVAVSATAPVAAEHGTSHLLPDHQESAPRSVDTSWPGETLRPHRYPVRRPTRPRGFVPDPVRFGSLSHLDQWTLRGGLDARW